VLGRDGGVTSARPVTAGTGARSYGATLIGNQLVVALQCADNTPPCLGAFPTLVSIRPH
jgi:hypothetical protein